MKNEIMIFENPEFGNLRTIEIDGKPWFVAKDVASALGYKDTSYAINAHCKGVGEIQTPTSGGMQTVKIIPESDLYRLILKSQLPSAEKYQDWVTEDVLPSIRKTGSYSLPGVELKRVSPVDETIEATKLFKPCFQIARMIGCDKNAAAISANTVVNKLTGKNLLKLLGQTHLESEIQELFFTPTELGERLGKISGIKFNLLLAEAGLQAKKNGAWVPLPEAASLYRIIDSGKRHSGGAMIQQIKWSDKVLDLINHDVAESMEIEVVN